MAHLIYQPFFVNDKYLQKQEQSNAKKHATRKHLDEVGINCGEVVSDSDGSLKLARSTSMSSGSTRSKANSQMSRGSTQSKANSSSASVSSIVPGIARSSTGNGGLVKTSKKGKVYSPLVVGTSNVQVRDDL